MKKTVFSKVFSRELMVHLANRRLIRSWGMWLGIGICLIPALLAGCAKNAPDLPIIAEVNGNPVYLNELAMLGSIAASEKGIDFNSLAGQQHYKEIAPNLYKTLIDIYVMKYSAEREGIAPTPEEVDKELARFAGNLKSQGQYEQFLTQLGIDETQLKETLQDRMAIQALQKKKLVDLQVEVTDEEVRDFYNQNMNLFRYPFLMRASQIFVAVPKDVSPEKRELARIRAEHLRKMVGDDPSKTFVGIARTQSDDTNTASRGGDLGFIYSDGNLKESFKKAAFALKEGEVSGVVETDLGFHIIWATDHEESFEEAEKQVRELKTQQKKALQFATWIEQAAKELNVVKLFDPVKFQMISKESLQPESTPEAVQ